MSLNTKRLFIILIYSFVIFVGSGCVFLSSDIRIYGPKPNSSFRVIYAVHLLYLHPNESSSESCPQFGSYEKINCVQYNLEGVQIKQREENNFQDRDIQIFILSLQYQSSCQLMHKTCESMRYSLRQIYRGHPII